MDAKRCKPAGPWHAFVSRRPPHTRPDKGPTWGEIHHRACTHAEHGVHAGLDEAGEMGIGTQAPIGRAHITGLSARMERVHLRELVGEEGRDHPFQEQAGAGTEQPLQSRHGNAAPRPRLRWLAEGLL